MKYHEARRIAEACLKPATDQFIDFHVAEQVIGNVTATLLKAHHRRPINPQILEKSHEHRKRQTKRNHPTR